MNERMKMLCSEVTEPLERIAKIADDPAKADSVSAALGMIATYAAGVADALNAVFLTRADEEETEGKEV